jgi:hypothetical protein
VQLVSIFSLKDEGRIDESAPITTLNHFFLKKKMLQLIALNLDLLALLTRDCG